MLIIATVEVTTISTTAMASSSASSVQGTSDIVTTPVFTEMHNGEQYTVDISLTYHKVTISARVLFMQIMRVKRQLHEFIPHKFS